MLHVSDLCRASKSKFHNSDRISGEAFNIGGGTANTLSLLELVRLLEDGGNRKINLAWGAARPCDKPVFSCDISKAERFLGRAPHVRAAESVRRLAAWVCENRSLFAPRPGLAAARRRTTRAATWASISPVSPPVAGIEKDFRSSASLPHEPSRIRNRRGCTCPRIGRCRPRQDSFLSGPRSAPVQSCLDY